MQITRNGQPITPPATPPAAEVPASVTSARQEFYTPRARDKGDVQSDLAVKYFWLLLRASMITAVCYFYFLPEYALWVSLAYNMVTIPFKGVTRQIRALHAELKQYG